MQINMVGQTAIAKRDMISNPATVAGKAVAAELRKVRTERQYIEPTSAETEVLITDEAESKDSSSGVLRLLQEGHFTGVADVRLRINFHDEIAAIEKEKATPIADGGITTLFELVNGQAEELRQENDLGEQTAEGIQEAVDKFNAVLSQGLDEFKNGTISSASELSIRLQTGFNEFMSAIQSIFDAISESDVIAPIGEVALEDGGVNQLAENLSSVTDNGDSTDKASSFDLQMFIADLTEAFKAKLLAMEMNLSGVQVLPPLSEPNGKGTAYQKFLNIYIEMQGVTQPEPDQLAVDTIV